MRAQSAFVRNAKFGNWDNSRYPRIALLDSQGRMVASDDDPRPNTMPELLEIVRRLRAMREKRDELLAQAGQGNRGRPTSGDAFARA